MSKPDLKPKAIVTRDITDRKRAEEALRLEKYFTDTVIDSIPGIFYVFDDREQLFRWNKRLEEYSGRSPEGMPTLRPHDFVSEENHGLLESALREVFVEHRNSDVELLILDREGRKVPFYCTGSPMTVGDKTYLVGLGIDITERKRAEEALRESEERFRLMADTAPVLLWQSGADSLCTFFNKPWFVFTGRSFEQEKGNGWAEGAHPDDLQRCLDTYLSAFNARRDFQMEYRLRRADGEYRWIADAGVPRFTPNDDFAGYIGSCFDITERKRAEEALQASENKFSKAFQAMPSVLVIASLADGRYMEVNEAFEQVMGYRRDEVIGRSSLALNVWQNQEDRAIVLRMLAEGKKVRDLEIGFMCKSGTILVGLYSADIIAIGAEQCLLSLVNDITERKKAEEELHRSEERYRRLYNDTPVMLHSIDPDGRLVSVSNYWLETLGYERSEVLGRIFTEFYTPASRSYATEVVLPEFFRTGSCEEVPYQIVKKNGEILDVQLSAIAEQDSEGKVVRSLAVMIDVTSRKRAEEEIERLNVGLTEWIAELDIANKDLGAFNYTVAHDLRQPLNVIGLSCQVIKELYGDQLPEECLDYIQDSYNSVLRMNELIEALLKFSRMRHVVPNREKVCLCMLAQEIASMLKQTEPERMVDFRIADGIVVNGDASLLRVVLNNLIGNAWKYTGMRENAVIEFGTTEIDGKPVYFVRDNGIGFDKAVADKLFMPFQRLPGAEEFKGSGIGLATVERIIQRHGGRIWAEGEPGKGATFYFTLSAD